VSELRAPFPYFGGKARVTDVIWRAFGSTVPNLVDPFCGSLAVLLLRPDGPGKIETVNDASAMICNFWRAVHADPDAVARWCDHPVNETELHSRHKWLVRHLAEIKPQIEQDPDFFDAKVAGWWVWGQCCWIGGGWCQEAQTTGEAYSPGRRPQLAGEGGVHLIRKRPGVAAGVHVEANWDEHTRLPSIANDRGIFGVSAPPCQEWFRALAARLRRVRVCCGDWRRVLGPGTLGKGKNVGGRSPCAVLLDPPYPHDHRDPHLYGGQDSPDVWWAARDWALEHGDDPELRIALCGYSGDFGGHAGWTEYAWRGARGYAGKDNANREQERIWFNSSCNRIDVQQELFRRKA
jgi:hypothetical protein